ncbi:hypothetical protein HN51_035138, partial [Arachis hypogaea]
MGLRQPTPSQHASETRSDEISVFSSHPSQLVMWQDLGQIPTFLGKSRWDLMWMLKT